LNKNGDRKTKFGMRSIIPMALSEIMLNLLFSLSSRMGNYIIAVLKMVMVVVVGGREA
jgi:hypothetical protein